MKDRESIQLKSEIYSQLGMLYVSNFINKEQSLKAKEYYIKSLDLLGGTELFDKSSGLSLPDNVN